MPFTLRLLREYIHAIIVLPTYATLRDATRCHCFEPSFIVCWLLRIRLDERRHIDATLILINTDIADITTLELRRASHVTP